MIDSSGRGVLGEARLGAGLCVCMGLGQRPALSPADIKATARLWRKNRMSDEPQFIRRGQAPTAPLIGSPAAAGQRPGILITRHER